VEIETVYDIGAHRGEWTNLARTALPDARFFLFEANPAHSDALRETGHAFFISVLSSEPKTVEFYATGSPGDSYFRETTKHYANVGPTSLRANTLDNLIIEHDLPYADLIKADVQGAELDVLRGGGEALNRAKLVLLECPILEYNESAPRSDEYFRFMDESGFTVLEFLDPIWKKTQMVQIDVLFAKIGVY
jgi:FkbM family methyltransferase